MNKKYLIFAGVAVLAAVIFVFVFLRKDGGSPFGGEKSAQEEVLAVLGYPAHFAVQYLPQERESGMGIIRHEIWYYPGIGKKIVFLGGNIAYTDKLDLNSSPKNQTALKPEDFDYETSFEEAKKLIGANAEPVDFLPDISEEGGVFSYISKNAVFSFDGGKLVYFQTMDSGAPSSPQAVYQDGYELPGFFSLKTAQAKSPFRNIFRCLGNVCRFVAEVPDKATRWMGPVLGPIASAIITQNLSGHAEIGRIFRDANRIDKIIKSVEEQKKLVNELKRVYADQANELRKRAEEIKKEKDVLGGRLVNGSITFEEYKSAAMDMHLVINSLEAGAEKISKAGERVNEGTISRMLGRDVLKQIASQTQGILMNEMQSEVRRLLNIDVVSNIIAQGEGGGDAVLELLISGELRGALAGGDRGIDIDELKKRIIAELRTMIENNKRDLRDNWSQRMADLINRTRRELEVSAQKPPETDLSGTICQSGAEKKSEQCNSGFEWRPNSGVGCVQADCNKIPGAHWSYEGYCVCGSSGSINENTNDANKECFLPQACSSCPGCVYSCVHFDEKCPVFPSK